MTAPDQFTNAEKEPDPNRKRSSIKNPKVSWASEEKLTSVREYVVEEDDDSAVVVSPSGAAGMHEHRSFESARQQELLLERAGFKSIQSFLLFFRIIVYSTQ